MIATQLLAKAIKELNWTVLKSGAVIWLIKDAPQVLDIQLPTVLRCWEIRKQPGDF